MFQEYKGVSKVYQGCFKDVLRVFQGIFKDVSCVFQGYFKGIKTIGFYIKATLSCESLLGHYSYKACKRRAFLDAKANKYPIQDLSRKCSAWKDFGLCNKILVVFKVGIN